MKPFASITIAMLIGGPQTLVGAQFRTDNIAATAVAYVGPGNGFTEGPAPDGHGGIWFTDIPNENIHRFDINSGETTIQNGNSSGANGLLFDSEGRLIAAEGSAQRVTRTDGVNVEVLADTWNGSRLNSPNDITLDSHGGIYFTDPAYFNNVQSEAVYYISPQGAVSQVISGLSRPNGIVLSPDQATLYVAEPTSNPYVGNPNMRIWKYDVSSPGIPTNKRLFLQSVFADGLAVDAYGNLFAATWFGFGAWTPEGEEIFQYQQNMQSTNLAFADPSGQYPNWLYITGGRSLYRTQLFPADDVAAVCDFDMDNDCDVNDIDTLTRLGNLEVGVNQGDTGYAAAFDLTGDSIISQPDIAAWLSIAATENCYAEPYVLGDTNLDGVVDFQDFVNVNNNWQATHLDNGMPVAWSSGDFDGNGVVEFSDFVAQNNNWQRAIAAGSAAAVPEPTTTWLVLLCVVGLVTRRGLDL